MEAGSTPDRWSLYRVPSSLKVRPGVVCGGAAAQITVNETDAEALVVLRTCSATEPSELMLPNAVTPLGSEPFTPTTTALRSPQGSALLLVRLFAAPMTDTLELV